MLAFRESVGLAKFVGIAKLVGIAKKLSSPKVVRIYKKWHRSRTSSECGHVNTTPSLSTKTPSSTKLQRSIHRPGSIFIPPWRTHTTTMTSSPDLPFIKQHGRLSYSLSDKVTLDHIYCSVIAYITWLTSHHMV